MRKIDFFKTLFTVCIFLFGIHAANADEEPQGTVLAHWTFENWLGLGEYPEGVEGDKPLDANHGLYSHIAKFGAGSQFSDYVGDREEPSTWSTPGSADSPRPEYVRISGKDVGDYYRITGLSADNYGPIHVMARLGTSSSGRHYEMMIQYRTSSTDNWIDATEPVRVESTSQSNMPIVFDHEMPWGINNEFEFELRFIMTANHSPEGSTPQTRFQEILITGETYTSTEDLVQQDDIRVFNVDGRLSVRGARGSDVEIYSITGAKVMELKNVNDVEGISLPTGQLYIVRIDNQAFKVVF